MAKFNDSSNAAALPQRPQRLARLLAESWLLAQIVLAALVLLALLSYSPRDPSWSHAVQTSQIANWGGHVGAWVADMLLSLFGIAAYGWVILLLHHASKLYRSITLMEGDSLRPQRAPSAGWMVTVLAFALLMVSVSGIAALRLWSLTLHMPDGNGGITGAIVGKAMLQAFGFMGGTLVLLFLLAISLPLLFRFSWLSVAEQLGGILLALIRRIGLRRDAARNRKTKEQEVIAERREHAFEPMRRRAEMPEPVMREPVLVMPTLVTPPNPPFPRNSPFKSARAEKEKQTPLFGELPDSALPPLTLLDPPSAQQEAVAPDMLDYTSRLIEKKLKDFGVEVSVVAAYPGPVVTRYEIEPATGIKGSQIVNLAKDLARALSLISLRVVETIPGKNYMALELPNPRRQMVRLSEILDSDTYADAASSLTMGLGKDIGGQPLCADLAKMPHLLVAGTTGSGKSVGINAMILSLLYKANAKQVRMIMIDPKMLELSVYEGIPHLLCPVVTDMRQAGHALNWVVAEMERRYKLMSKLGVRNLAGYNTKITEAAKRDEKIPNPFSLTPDAPEPLDQLPTIVVVIDELADLMMVVGKKVEELIARIAQKARAAGIHLILATQRPSVDVITGLIKANVPARIAFQVSSKIDSRTILDQQGADTLLGMGDMLYLPPGTGLPVRVHGAFVSDDEVHRVVEKLREQGEPDYIEGLLEGSAGAEGETVDSAFTANASAGSGTGESDPLYDQAVEIVVQHRRASISLVQRHLRIGYNRAARLLEQMEQAGMVSAMTSSGNREILVPRREE